MKYISNLFNTGAIRKTPPRIIRRIVSELGNDSGKGIIEFGAGKGEITRLVVEQARGAGQPLDGYFAFEIDPNFAQVLRTELPEVTVLSEDAFAFDNTLPASFRPKYIISSFPLSFYPRPKREAFLAALRERVADGGKVIVLYHAFWLSRRMKRVFPSANIAAFVTIPPYFLLVYEKGNRPPK